MNTTEVSQARDPLQNLQWADLAAATIFPAALVHACLKSVPLDITAARETIKYVSETILMQSTLDYLLDPPSSYQQPLIDVTQMLGMLDELLQMGALNDQYSFETALQRVALRMHDGHVAFPMPLTDAVTFGSPLTLMSLSGTNDGRDFPKIYVSSDLQRSDYIRSAVVAINGYDTYNYLERYARLTVSGNIDPQADWNDLFDSFAALTIDSFSSFDMASPIFVDEQISFKFENGSSTAPVDYYASFDISSCPTVASGKDVYACLVAPSAGEAAQSIFSNDTEPAYSTASVDASPWPSNALYALTTAAIPTLNIAERIYNAMAGPRATATPVESDPLKSRVPKPAYPSDPVIAQPDLGGDGFVTGYYVKVNKTYSFGVLSIPTFDVTGEAIATFSDTIACFIQRTQTDRITEVVIDLQRNKGGSSILAWNTFSQFFPDIIPFAGSRLRATHVTNDIGAALTPFGESIQEKKNASYGDFLDDPWAVTKYINPRTDSRFTSWPSFFQSLDQDSRGEFTAVKRTNLRYNDFDRAATADDASERQYGITYGRNIADTAPPFDVDSILLLTDGLCGSACALFAEAMTHEVGVKTVVVGGHPQPGLMQAVGGTRGSQKWDSISVDHDKALAHELLRSDAHRVLATRNPGILSDTVTFTLADQIRRGEYAPLQFSYEPANCRIFYTFENYRDYNRLWTDAADALWGINHYQSATCVDGSRYDYPRGAAITDFTGPFEDDKNQWRAWGRLHVSEATRTDTNNDPAYRFSDPGSPFEAFSGKVATSGSINGGLWVQANGQGQQRSRPNRIQKLRNRWHNAQTKVHLRQAALNGAVRSPQAKSTNAPFEPTKALKAEAATYAAYASAVASQLCDLDACPNRRKS
ncbi:MAG: hypothetical protein Q9159_001541 [Coniocarpon cinnabarinum]